MKTSINNASPLLLIPLVVFVQFLWTGVYLLTRNYKDRFSIFAGFAMLGVCVYIIGTALGEISTSFEEARYYTANFWIAPIIPVFWLHAVLEQVGVSRKYLILKKYSLAGLYTISFTLIILAQTTNLVIDSTTASWVEDRAPRFIVEPGILYDFVIFFLFSVLFFTTIKIVATAIRNWKLIDTTLKKYYVTLGVSTAMFTAGATITSFDFRNYDTWKRPESQDQWIILLGLLILIIALIWYKFGDEKKSENSFVLNVDFVSQSLVVYLLTAAVVSILYFSFMKPPMIVLTITMVIVFFSGYETVMLKLNRFFEKRLAFSSASLLSGKSGGVSISGSTDQSGAHSGSDGENIQLDASEGNKQPVKDIFHDTDVIKDTLRILSNPKIGKDFEQAEIFKIIYVDLIDPDGRFNNTERAKALYDMLWRVVNKLHPFDSGNGYKECLHIELNEIDGETWGPFACLLYLIYGGRKAPGEISRLLIMAKQVKNEEEINRCECFLKLVSWRGNVGRSNYRKVQVWEEIALDAFKEQLNQEIFHRRLPN